MTSYIYTISNKLNNKTYVGKSNNTKQRFNNHFHSKSYIGNALRKYGKENFVFQIIEEYKFEEEAYEAEQFFIQYLGTQTPFGYNLVSGGKGGSAGVRRKLSSETKRKISETLKGHIVSEQTKKKLSENHMFHKHSEETKKKMSSKIRSEEFKRKISKILKGHIVSEETKRKISKANKGRKHSEETRKKMSNKKLSEEHKKKISESRKRKIINKN